MRISRIDWDFGALRAAAIGIAISLATATATLAEDTIKVGVLLIDSGPLAGLKETQVKAVNLAIDHVNAAGGVLGKKLEADFITYPGTPDTAVDGATRAVQKDGAVFITGMDTSAVSPALAAKLPSLKALMVEVFAQELAGFRIEQANVDVVPLHVHLPSDPAGRCAIVGGLDLDTAVQMHGATAELVVAKRFQG